MNQIQRLIETVRDAPHDALVVAGMYTIPILIALWIVNRMRHPQRGFLNALVIASVGFVTVPWISSMVLILWVRTGGDNLQATCVSIFLFVFGFWALRRWIRSAPRAAKPTKALVAPVAHAAPPSDLAGEVAELRAEVARLQAERQHRSREDVDVKISPPWFTSPRTAFDPFYSRPLSPRASLCRIGPRRQGFASPLRALDGSGPWGARAS